MPLLLAPAGSYESLEAGLQNGADAVYFGVGKLNMRSNATVNFTVDDLPEVAARCHARNAKAWLAVNTIIFDSELEEVRELCRRAKEARIDAVIASDPAVMRIARSMKLPVHLSVQANIANTETVRFYSQFADVVVLARELTLDQIAHICRTIREEKICGPSGELIKVEIFIHGALCVAVSGKCGMSLAAYNSSANRGACFQNCRRSYTVRDTETGTADYVAPVVRVYRAALDQWLRGEPLRPEQLAKWEEELASVFNRGFWKGGYYLGNRLGEWAACGDSQATVRKEFVGRIVNYYKKPEVAELQMTSGELVPGDRILVTGDTTGAQELKVDEFLLDGAAVNPAKKGMNVTFLSPVRLRANDKVYKLIERSRS